MAKEVCLAVISDEASRFVIGTYPVVCGLQRLLWGSAQFDRNAEMIEGWDFDREAGVLRVAYDPGSAKPVREIPLEILVNLSWGCVNESRVSDEDPHYEVRLFFDDGGRPIFVSLPGSADYLCSSSDQAREMERRLRPFLKPLCPRLESTTWEELVKFWQDPAGGFQSIQQRVQTRLTALDNLSGHCTPPATGQAEAGQTADPTASARELLTQLHSALGRLGEAAAEQQKKRAESGGRDTGGVVRMILFLVFIALCFGIGLFVFGK
jgi:hypothetical protein